MPAEGLAVVAGDGAGDGFGERPAVVQGAPGGGEGSPRQLQVAAGDRLRQAERAGDLGGGGEQGDHAAGRQGRREVVERARFRRHLGGGGAPGGGQPEGQILRPRVAVHREEDAPSLGGIGERLGKGLQRMERADLRSPGPQRRERRGVQAAGGVERHPRLRPAGQLRRHLRDRAVPHRDQQQILTHRIEIRRPDLERPPRPGRLSRVPPGDRHQLGPAGQGPARQARSHPPGTGDGEAQTGERSVLRESPARGGHKRYNSPVASALQG